MAKWKLGQFREDSSDWSLFVTQGTVSEKDIKVPSGQYAADAL